ncbi:MAG: putative hydro-lyase [Rhodospirillaceae bacterium]|nr:putative hydro-lyase [Rhodospirillaceae bacterium]MBT4489406.1 putative hydro-lyase [Rhodospirillaceae bacterium]MBT5898641.1 putative hydro-lyase [Rhodospirillaceae bacterium]MBT6431107.1 putative hydro-lyase [Rhodospirillaceae bacterium]
MRDFEDQSNNLSEASPAHVRGLIRRGDITGQTGGMAFGYMQGNLAILPSDLALDFARYCQRNPKPCPLVGISETGDPMLRTLGEDIDIRSDISSYNVYRDGELADTVTDITELWRDDLVAFVLGCSFSFEEALQAGGVPLRHLEVGYVVPMYRSNIQTVPAGPFHGPTVVSMRPMPMTEAIRAVEITARFPMMHGKPVHIGDPAGIGIGDLNDPVWGDVPDIREGEVPVFWACGVTPQAAVMAAKPAFCITHKPGSMLITDLPSGSVT